MLQRFVGADQIGWNAFLRRHLAPPVTQLFENATLVGSQRTQLSRWPFDPRSSAGNHLSRWRSDSRTMQLFGQSPLALQAFGKFLKHLQGNLRIKRGIIELFTAE